MEGKIRLNSLEPVREGRLRGFGHVLRRVTLEDVEDGAAGQEVKKKTTDVNMQRVCVTEEDSRDSVRRRQDDLLG